MKKLLIPIIVATVCANSLGQENHNVVKTIDFTRKDGSAPKIENRTKNNNGQSKVVKSYDFTKKSGIQGATIVGKATSTKTTSSTSKTTSANTRATTGSSPKTTASNTTSSKKTYKTPKTQAANAAKDVPIRPAAYRSQTSQATQQAKTPSPATRPSQKWNNQPKVSIAAKPKNNAAYGKKTYGRQSWTQNAEKFKQPTSSFSITLGNEVPAGTQLGQGVTIGSQPAGSKETVRISQAPTPDFALATPKPKQIPAPTPAPEPAPAVIPAMPSSSYTAPAPSLSSAEDSIQSFAADPYSPNEPYNDNWGGVTIVNAEPISSSPNASVSSEFSAPQVLNMTHSGKRVRLSQNPPPISNKGTKINLKPMPQIQTRNLTSPNEHGTVILVQKGKASYYGAKFHGKRTASGERFNMYGYTAAHPTLPFGTKVQVINLHNGRVVTVRINDRGPHGKGRIIDLSKAAADMLHMSKSGTALVRIKAYR